MNSRMTCGVDFMMKRVKILIIFFTLCISLPAHTSPAPEEPSSDPLKYSKKIIVEGHKTLYRNGAFPVPYTSINLIPAGPNAFEFAMELAGLRARQSFLLALKRAGESVNVVTEGSKKSFELAAKIHKKTGGIAGAIKKGSRKTGKKIIYASADTAGKIMGESWKFSAGLIRDMKKYGVMVDEKISEAGMEVGERGTEQGVQIAEKSLDLAASISRGSIEVSKKSLLYSKTVFIKGYAAIPRKLAGRLVDVKSSVKQNSFKSVFKKESERRKKWSLKMTDVIGQTVKNYTREINESFSKAKNEIKNHRSTGISLAALRSFRWVLKGLFYDSIIKPVTKVSFCSLGYVGINGVAFPVLLTLHEGKSVTLIAVNISWNSLKTAYDIVAPTPTAAVAGVFSVMSAMGGNVAAAAVGGGGAAVGYSEAGLSKVVNVVAKGGGKAGGAVVQYVGVPLASAGVVVGGGVVGTVVGATGTTAGAALFVGGETASAMTYGMGNIISGSVLAGGAAVSTAAGGTVGVYQISKAVAVPAGYEVGAGMVVSYDTLSHIAAHSILAVSDFSYVVLSLEGPRWVLYAVKGNLGSGDDLPPGTLLELNEMRAQGEEIVNLPVSGEEMKNVVDSVYNGLPVFDSFRGEPAKSEK